MLEAEQPTLPNNNNAEGRSLWNLYFYRNWLSNTIFYCSWLCYNTDDVINSICSNYCVVEKVALNIRYLYTETMDEYAEAFLYIMGGVALSIAAPCLVICGINSVVKYFGSKESVNIIREDPNPLSTGIEGHLDDEEKLPLNINSYHYRL